MKILIGVSGGIAAYKTASLVSYLSAKHDVKVIMTEHATDFITPLTFQTLSKQAVITDMSNTDSPEIIDHIYYPQNYDIMVIAPATANIIAKAANGIADDALSTSIVACTIPLIFVPSMNTHMYENANVQANIKRLAWNGCHVIKPDCGKLACGINGKGKFPPLKDITACMSEILQTEI